MNYIRLGLLCITLFIAGNVSAQSNSSLNGKKYWIELRSCNVCNRNLLGHFLCVGFATVICLEE